MQSRQRQQRRKLLECGKAEQRDQAMIALSEKRYKLLGEDTIQECLKQLDEARKAVSCQRRGSIFP
jgi:hypothetical protein